MANVERICAWRRWLIQRLPESFQSRYQEWTRYAYLGDFECGLHTVLWALLWLFIVYGVLQHVVLAEVPEVFPTGARWGQLLYDFGLAYSVAFTFYLLTIRLALRRNRRNVYQHLAPLINRVVGEARNLIGYLNSAAGFNDSRENSLANVQETCGKIKAGQRADLLVPGPTGRLMQASVLDAISHYLTRARHVNNEILAFSDYVDTDLIRLISDIENRSYFRLFDNYVPLINRGPLKEDDWDLSFIAREIFDYLQMVDKVDDYIQEHLPTTFARPPYLVSASNRTSDAIPLRRYIRPEAANGGATLNLVAPNAEITDTTALQDDEQE
jgi:hypothetical protein